jgi:hypothetical protein
LSAVARTAAQICALATVALRRGEIDAAMGLALRGLEARRSSPTCRAKLQAAREAMRARDAMRAGGGAAPVLCVGRCASGPTSR